MEKDQAQQQDTEFSLSAVPESERKSYFSLTIVWTGFVFVITSMMAGGGLSAGLDFKMILLAVLLGNVFLSAIAILVSIIASRTGLTFALMTRYSFGEKGSRIASMFVPIVNIGSLQQIEEKGYQFSLIAKGMGSIHAPVSGFQRMFHQPLCQGNIPHLIKPYTKHGHFYSIGKRIF